MDYNEVIETKYGKMIVNKHDIGVGKQLRSYGEYARYETENLFELIKAIGPEAIVLDVGANVGAHTLLFAPYVKKVFSFEAQLKIFYMLCGNLALNSIDNVVATHSVVGKRKDDVNGDYYTIEIPRIRYDQPANFGGFQITDIQFDVGQYSQKGGLFHEQEWAAVIELDDLIEYEFDRLDFIKLDIEGHEQQALEASRFLIQEFFPYVFVETYKSDAKWLIDYFKSYSYTVYQADEMNLLCVPHNKEKPDIVFSKAEVL